MERENDYEENEQNGIILDREFQGDDVFSISIIEVFSTLKYQDQKVGRKNFEDNPVIKQTQEYLEKFNLYDTSNEATKKAQCLRKILEENGDKVDFTSIEQTQLIDLLPQNADEAFNLIPSLKGKIEKEKLQYYLELLKKER